MERLKSNVLPPGARRAGVKRRAQGAKVRWNTRVPAPTEGGPGQIQRVKHAEISDREA